MKKVSEKTSDDKVPVLKKSSVVKGKAPVQSSSSSISGTSGPSGHIAAWFFEFEIFLEFENLF
jgi:hypothetical protein